MSRSHFSSCVTALAAVCRLIGERAPLPMRRLQSRGCLLGYCDRSVLLGHRAVPVNSVAGAARGVSALTSSPPPRRAHPGGAEPARPRPSGGGAEGASALAAHRRGPNPASQGLCLSGVALLPELGALLPHVSRGCRQVGGLVWGWMCVVSSDSLAL